MRKKRTKDSESMGRHAGKTLIQTLGKTAVTILLLVALILGMKDYGIPFLTNLFFSEHIEVSNIMVEQKLQAIGELATYEYEYSGIAEEETTREVFGISVPGTKNSIRVVYSGVIKVGFEIADLIIDVDPVSYIISVTLPEPKVISNSIDENSLQYTENNNIFNPIKTESMTELLNSQKQENLKKAEEQGIYEDAKENAESIIRESLEVFEDYQIVFQ